MLASAAMLAGAHAFERIGGMDPCSLCLRQREVYWAALAVGAAGLFGVQFLRREEIRRFASVMLGIVFLVGAVVAAYHVGVEWKWWPGPQSCGAGADLGAITTGSIAAALEGKKVVVRCDEAAWRMFGISMAGYNVAISLFLAALSIRAALPPAPESRE
jgi:disulfide bond formation protein DsbB